MLIDVRRVERIGQGSIELDRLFGLLSQDNAAEWVDDLLAMIGNKDDVVAYGAATTLGATVHSILIQVNAGQWNEELDIPEALRLPEDGEESEEAEEIGIYGKDLFVYDALGDEDRNINFFKTLFKRFRTAREIGLLLALTDMIAEGIAAIPVHPAYLWTYREEVCRILENCKIENVRQILEQALQLADEDLAALVGEN